MSAGALGETRYKEVQELLKDGLEGAKSSRLNQWEKDFLLGLRGRCASFHENAYVTEPQWETVQRISAKLYRVG